LCSAEHTPLTRNVFHSILSLSADLRQSLFKRLFSTKHLHVEGALPADAIATNVKCSCSNRTFFSRTKIWRLCSNDFVHSMAKSRLSVYIHHKTRFKRNAHM